jgi:tRNA (guanine37-N1)-methyltransferase
LSFRPENSLNFTGEKIVAKKPCIKINNSYGEKTIAITKKIGLLNNDLKIHRERDYLYIPLIRKPQKTDLKELKTNLPSVEILEHEFLENVERPPKLVDLLNNELPSNMLSSLPHSIDHVGDIAVIEVPSELEEYRTIIGQAILAMNKRLSTVLAKAGAVSGEYRLREFETIAGVNKTATVHKEHGCVFRVDLAKAYFSPRLSYEHNRVASLVNENETVLDMFAGVGPFSILIAKKHKNVHVYATEVNPEAFKLLKKNILVNRVATKIVPLLGDARQIAQEKLKPTIDRVIMNLPEKAIEYVDVACHVIKPNGGIIHYYEFTSTTYPLETVKTRLEEAVKQTNRKVEKMLNSKIVRGVAPFKWQVVVDAQIK